jgi:hypothetical protein
MPSGTRVDVIDKQTGRRAETDRPTGREAQQAFTGLLPQPAMIIEYPAVHELTLQINRQTDGHIGRQTD